MLPGNFPPQAVLPQAVLPQTVLLQIRSSCSNFDSPLQRETVTVSNTFASPMSITFWMTISVLLSPLTCIAQDAKATITWIVKVPSGTPNQAKLYLAGNQDLFGPWKPNQFQLQKQNDGNYRCEATFPVGTDIEYKFTRGSWASVEKSETGDEIQNRRLRVEKDVELAIDIASWAIPVKEQESTATGDLRWKDFDSKLLAGKRRVTVWLPPDYKSHNNHQGKNSNTPVENGEQRPSAANATERYPVVYFLDGQNMFDASRAAFGTEWKADETAKGLASQNPPLRLILVAIDNSQERMSEYTPVQDRVGDAVVGGQAEKYLTFITQEIKPWIDSEFATDPSPESTAIAGSSLGGLFALFAAFQKPDIFGRAISMSPSLFWGKEAMLQDCKRSAQNTWNSPKQRLWIDMGTEEGNTPEAKERNSTLTKTYVKLLEVNYSERFEIGTTIAEGARHHESAWADRLPQALRFIFDDKTSSPTR